MPVIRYVTAGSSAADVNGGGQQLGTNDGPIVTKADCTSDGAGTTITNNGGDGWAPAAVNDGICFDTASAKNYSVITGINGNQITVLPAVGANQAHKAVNVGGAFATLARSVAVARAGEEHRWCGNYSISAALAPANAGTVSSPIRYIGYAADKSAPASITITQTGTGIILSLTTSNVYTYVENVNFVLSGSTGSNYNVKGDGQGLRFSNCSTSCTGATKRPGFYSGYHAKFVNCLASSCTIGFYVNSDADFHGCRATGCSTAGVLVGNASGIAPTLLDCLIDGNTGDGVQVASAGTNRGVSILQSTIVGNTGDGIDITSGSAAGDFLVANSIIARNGAYGITAGAAVNITSYGCLIPASGTDANGSGALHGNVSVTLPQGLPANLTGSQLCAFVNVGASDYRIGSSSAAKGLGWPGTMPGLAAPVSTGVGDAGAVERAEPTLPAVGNVKSGVHYGDYGTELTGTYSAGGNSTIGSGIIKRTGV
jgi:hypothetical protein